MDDAEPKAEATAAVPPPRGPRSLQPSSPATDKAQRLAAALRANLRRRKVARPAKPSN